MNPLGPFKPPNRPPTRRSHLERMVEAYARDHALPQARVRRLVSSLALIGALQRITDERDDPRFLVKGGVAMELRLGVEARSTQDFDAVFRGALADLCDALDDAFLEPYSGFELTRHGEPAYIGQTSTQRQAIKIAFNGRAWQTLTMEIARPEGSRGGDPEIVPAAISIHQFGLNSPRRVAVMAIRYQIAQKVHAVTERPADRENARHWDLIDLLLLRDLVNDLAPIREACIEVFDNRATHAWPPELMIPESWKAPYEAAAQELRFTPADLDQAASDVRVFIAQIDSATPA